MGISYWIISYSASYFFFYLFGMINPWNFSSCFRAAFCIILKCLSKFELLLWDCTELGKFILVIAVGEMYYMSWICSISWCGRKFYYSPDLKGFAILYYPYFEGRWDYLFVVRLGLLTHYWIKGELLNEYMECLPKNLLYKFC